MSCSGDTFSSPLDAGSILFEQAENLTRLGVPFFQRFLIHRHSVTEHLEAPAARRNQLDGGGGISLLQLSRQTGGSGLVVSDRAVFDRDLHRRLALRKWSDVTQAEGRGQTPR
jgi:hypothetical protein